MDNFTFVLTILIIFIVVLSLLWLFIGGGTYKFEGLHFLDPPDGNAGDLESDSEDESTCLVEDLKDEPIGESREVKNESIDDLNNLNEEEGLPEIIELSSYINTSEPTEIEYIPTVTVKLPSLKIDYYENFILENVNKKGKHMNKRTALESRGEKLCRSILEKFYNKPFPTCRPDFLNNPETGFNLELDCYNEELGIALEYNGSQHYDYPNGFHKSEEEYQEQLRRDDLKKQICADLGIYLLIVPFRIPHGHIPKYIEYYLPENVKYRQDNGISDQEESEFWDDAKNNLNPHGYV